MAEEPKGKDAANTDLFVDVNGKKISLAGVDAHKSLLHFLRERGLTGTKEGCAEGECGACAVVVQRSDLNDAETNSTQSRLTPINSCLVLAKNLAGAKVTTVEGVAKGGELHPVQSAMVEKAGSQCGYCTPGFVMSLYAEYYNKARKDGEVDIESIAGNLCRCTGYRPIRDVLVELKVPSDSDEQKVALKSPAPEVRAFCRPDFSRPTSLSGVFEALEQNPGASLIAGGTDLVVGINQFEARHAGFIALDSVSELKDISENDDEIRIGAGVPLSDVEAFFHGDARLSVFEELFSLFSSRLIRNRATLGGNLVNASPIGDSPPVLLSLEGELELQDKSATRRVKLSEFFTGYRQTVLSPGELVVAVCLPKPLPTISRFYKVSKRVMDDISTVAAGFSVWMNNAGEVEKVRLGYGGVAATPMRATDAEALMEQNGLVMNAALKASLDGAFTPMDDHRGSAKYRNAMVARLVEKFLSEITQAQAAE